MKNYVAAAIVINVLVILSVLALIGFLPPQVPLFYGLPEGQDQLATSWFLILPATTSLFILTSNLLITPLIKESFLQKTLVLAGIATVFFSTITTIKIIFLVGSF